MYDTQTNWIRYIACLIGIVFSCLAVSCNEKNKRDREIEKWQQKMDDMGNMQLDTIYKKQSLACDSLQKVRIPVIVDSLLKDSGFLKIRRMKQLNTLNTHPSKK